MAPMIWVIEGLLARGHRPGKYGRDPMRVTLAETEEWLEVAKDLELKVLRSAVDHRFTGPSSDDAPDDDPTSGPVEN